MAYTIDTSTTPPTVRAGRDGFASPTALARSGVSSAALVALYNRGAPRPVRKFENREVAARRVFPLLGDLAVDSSPAAAVKSRARGRRLGIGRRMAEHLRAGMSTAEVVCAIRTEFPSSTAGPGDVSIIRGKVARGEL